MSSSTGATRAPGGVDSRDGLDRGPSRVRRLSTETKAAFKTTEFFAYLAVLAGVLIAAAVISGDGGNDADIFGANDAWLYATILTAGYMISRGLAKSGSREPYDDSNA